MTLKEKLQAARALIADPDTWCTGVFAQDPHGDQVYPTSPDACRFCAFGAAYRIEDVIPDVDHIGTTSVLAEAAKELFGEHASVPDINDTLGQGHAAVLKIYDRAIERAS